MDEYEIVVYAKENGKEPFTQWLKSVKDKKMQRLILLRIQRVRQGNFGNCKSLSGYKGLQEIRINSGPGYRIYFTKEKERVVLLLGGGDKSTQTDDIEKAYQCMSEYKMVSVT